MINTMGRRRRPRRLVVVLVLGATMALLAVWPSSVVVGAEPTRAAGWIRGWSFDNVVDRMDDTVKACGPGSFTDATSFVIGVRMERRGTTWVDAGSTFRAEAGGMGPPCAFTYGPNNGICWEYDEHSVFAAAGPIMGRPPLPPLDAEASIRLSIDPVAGTASFGATLVGNWPVATDPDNGIEYEETNGFGGSCTNSYPPSVTKIDAVGGGGWRVGRAVAVPPCPGTAYGAAGLLDASRTRITFSCSRDESGPTPDGNGTDQVRSGISGSITLSP